MAEKICQSSATPKPALKRVEAAKAPGQESQGELAAFEERVRLMTQKGMLLPFPVALYVAGISDTRLRQLVASGRLETTIIDQRPYIVLRSLIAYRRQALRRLASRNRTRS